MGPLQDTVALAQGLREDEDEIIIKGSGRGRCHAGATVDVIRPSRRANEAVKSKKLEIKVTTELEEPDECNIP